MKRLRYNSLNERQKHKFREALFDGIKPTIGANMMMLPQANDFLHIIFEEANPKVPVHWLEEIEKFK